MERKWKDKKMNRFTIKGDEKDPYSFWLINGSENFAIIPSNTIDGIHYDIPIRLQAGNQVFGAKHINMRHGSWVKKCMKHKTGDDPRLVPALLHKKLNQVGQIYQIRDEKFSIVLSLTPNTSLFLKKIQDYLSVTTFYYKQNSQDELWIPQGRYLSKFGTK